MKMIKTTFIGAILLSSFLPTLTAQQTTTLSEITKLEREKELERRQINHQLANPVNKSAKSLSANNRQAQTLSYELSEEDQQVIQNKIEKKKANLEIMKESNPSNKKAIQQMQKEIKAMEKELLPKKTKSNLPVVESN